MELFTEIEFNKEELARIDEVMYHLAQEGWEVVNTDEYKTNNTVIAKKFKLRREFK